MKLVSKLARLLLNVVDVSSAALVRGIAWIVEFAIRLVRPYIRMSISLIARSRLWNWLSRQSRTIAVYVHKTVWRFWRSRVVRYVRGWPPVYKKAASFVLILLLVTFGYLYIHNQQYVLAAGEQKLLSKPSVDLRVIKESKTAFTYSNAEEKKKDGPSVVAAASAADSTGKFPYEVTLPKNANKGITFSDSTGDLSFTLKPNFAMAGGRLQQGRVLYPEGTNSIHSYTLKRNGIKEDIVISKVPGSDTYTKSWQLDLGDKLEAHMLPNGAVGIYSANPYLFGNLQVGDSKSQSLLDNARKNGKKNNLEFVIPAPYVMDASHKKQYEGVKYVLEANNLTLTVNDMKQRTYPLSIDPSVVVTTTADFQLGTDNGMIDYSTAGQITASSASNGGIPGVSASYFNRQRSGLASVTYNGYLYVVGGSHTASDTTCVNTGVSNTRCNDIQRMPINSDGSLGTISTSYFNIPRSGLAATAYNGYLYLIGGQQTNSDTACVNTGVNNSVCNDIQRMPINSDGSLGTISTSYFNIPRSGLAATNYNGYMYIMGGSHGANDTACVNTGVNNSVCNDIQRMPINSDGSLGTISTSYFNTPRQNLIPVAHNGFLYIVGGNHPNQDTSCINTGVNDQQCNDIQRMPINSDGSLGTISTSYFNTPRTGLAAFAYNSNLYIIGGTHGVSDTACVNTGVASLQCNDIQRMPINSDGSLGTISTSYFKTPRSSFAATAYNGYLYIEGGSHPSLDKACVNTGANDTQCNEIQSLALAQSGDVGITDSYFNTPRSFATSATYNGYLYIIGGAHATSDTACVNTGVNNTNCNDIQRMPINSDGSLGTISTSYFNTPRQALVAVAYNGYLYIIGGAHATSDTACVNTGVNTSDCNDIQRMPINSDGSLGTISTSYFNTPRDDFSAVAYNGHLYIIGGEHATSDTACVNTGVNNSFCNDIQRMPINSDGSLGTISTSYFNTPRHGLATVAYSGFLYVIGGQKISFDTACVNTGVSNFRCNDIQRMPINSDGSLGTISTSYFNTGRLRAFAAAYNGYLYIFGGFQSTSDTACVNTGVATQYCNDIQRMPINSDGSLGTISTSYFNVPRTQFNTIVYNGYTYVVGGAQANTDTSCVNTGVNNSNCNDIQRMPINSDGALGTISTSYFNTPRSGQASVAYNGYLYIIGGGRSTTDTACVNTGVSNQRCNDIQRMPINSDGSLGTISTSYFNTPRQFASAVAYNGFLYIIGGQQTNTDTACVNTGVSNQRCNDIQRMPINSDGSLGTISTSYFNVPRWELSAVAYNGFLYIIGGQQTNTDTACVNTGVSNQRCNDIQRMPINSDGSLGTISTSYFNVPRNLLATIGYNGYLYIMGGSQTNTDTACVNTGVNNSNCNDIQRFSISTSNGSLTLQGTSYFNIPRETDTAVATGGFLYIIGGDRTTSDTACVNTGVSTTNCNDIQRMPINSDGSLGTISTSYFNVPRTGMTNVTNNGTLYIMGGGHSTTDTACVNTGVNITSCNDIQRQGLLQSTPNSEYSRQIDLGLKVTISDIIINGSAPCGLGFSYRTAGPDGVYGSWLSTDSYVLGGTYNIGIAAQRFINVLVTFNASVCGTAGYITDITIDYTDNDVPAVPTLISPVTTGTSIFPLFQLRSTDAESDYLQYKIEICSTSDCSNVVSTIDETSSQTGWQAQDQQSGTAYTSATTLSNSRIAQYQWQQPNLTPGTQYWWRAYAIDPGGSNTFSSASSISTFTTGATETNLGGGSTFMGGTIIQ